MKELLQKKIEEVTNQLKQLESQHNQIVEALEQTVKQVIFTQGQLIALKNLLEEENKPAV